MHEIVFLAQWDGNGSGDYMGFLYWRLSGVDCTVCLHFQELRLACSALCSEGIKQWRLLPEPFCFELVSAKGVKYQSLASRKAKARNQEAKFE